MMSRRPGRFPLEPVENPILFAREEWSGALLTGAEKRPVSVFYSLMRSLKSSLAMQLCVAIVVEVIILSLLVGPLDQQQGFVRENESSFVGGSPGIISAAIAFSLLTALLAARNVERRLQDLARRSERFALGDRAVRIHEAWEDELPLVDHAVDGSFDPDAESKTSGEQAQHIASIGPWQYKSDQPTLFWSQETFDAVGLSSAAPAQSFEDFLAGLQEEQKATLLERFEDLKPGEERGFNLIVNRPDGTQRRCWAEARAERKADGEKLLIGTCRDVSDGGAAAAQLQEAFTIQAPDRLTRSLVHDLNNLLSTAVGNLDLLEEQLPQASTERELVESALRAALQGAELGKQLLALSPREPVDLKTIDLSHQIDSTPVQGGTEVAAPVEADSEMLPPNNNLVVLVVEDEEDVRKTVERQLEELGYNVVCASNAKDALGIIDDGFRIDLLFTDIKMDGDLDGVDLATKALAKKPNLKVLHTSGYMSASEQAGREVKRLLTKPYRRSTLSSAIQSTIDDDSDEEFRL